MKRAIIAIPPRPEPPLPVAISECLIGTAVRYDGTGARSSFPHEACNGLLAFVPICPEVGIGMEVPRPPVQLVGDPRKPRVLAVHDRSVDVTEALQQYARARSGQLDGVSGYVFMERSPSCGLYSVPVHSVNRGEAPKPTGRGAYARTVSDLFPLLPIEENGRLFDADVRESFFARVFAYAHWQRLVDGGLSAARLMEFHSRYKYLLMAHSVSHYRRAGRLLGDPESHARQLGACGHSPSGAASGLTECGARYLECLMEGLSLPATRGGHANVLSHLQGYLRRRLNGAERLELTELIDEYRRGNVARRAVRRLLLRHLEVHPHAYLANQVYLQPMPNELGC